jgi:hypothetical protein
MESEINNFLPKKDFNEINNIINHIHYPWYVDAHHAETQKHFHFVHDFYHKDKDVRPKVDDYFYDIFYKKISDQVGFKIKILKARVNLFVKSSFKYLDYHQDYKEGLSMLLYMEDSDGCTQFQNGKTINSVENKALFFNANSIHRTVMQKNSFLRKNINVNFKEDI